MNYSKEIQLLRKEMILTQKELAEILNVSFVTVNRWEKGKFEPTMKIKRSLSKLFNQYNIYRLINSGGGTLDDNIN